MTTLYGISNCDTCRKARKFLDGAGVSYRFHDLRQDGLSSEQVHRWLAAVGADALVNRRSTTWRGLSETDRSRIANDSVADLLLSHPTLIKRPVLETGNTVHVGFRDADYQALLELD